MCANCVKYSVCPCVLFVEGVCACVYMCVCAYVQCVHRFVFHTCSHFRCTVTVKHGLNYTRAPTLTQTHACTHTDMHAYTHRLTHRHRHTHACTDSHTDSHTDARTHTDTRTHARTHACMHGHTHNTQTRTHTDSHTHRGVCMHIAPSLPSPCVTMIALLYRYSVMYTAYCHSGLG